MPRLIEIPSFKDARGSLTVVEKVLPFQIRRVFFVHDVSAPRGGHRHHKTQMALIAVSGKIRIVCQSPEKDEIFWLEHPSQCLLLDPQDWHQMDNFEEKATLVVLASEDFNKEDYIYEKYR